MPSKELIEKVARDICDDIGAEYDEHPSYWNKFAEVAADTILAALQEPTPAMQLVVSANWGRRTWAEYQQVLAASALGEQSE